MTGWATGSKSHIWINSQWRGQRPWNSPVYHIELLFSTFGNLQHLGRYVPVVALFFCKDLVRHLGSIGPFQPPILLNVSPISTFSQSGTFFRGTNHRASTGQRDPKDVPHQFASNLRQTGANWIALTKRNVKLTGNYRGKELLRFEIGKWKGEDILCVLKCPTASHK